MRADGEANAQKIMDVLCEEKCLQINHYFEKQGYSVFGTAHETDSSVTALLTKGDGSYIVLFHHKRK